MTYVDPLVTPTPAPLSIPSPLAALIPYHTNPSNPCENTPPLFPVRRGSTGLALWFCGTDRGPVPEQCPNLIVITGAHSFQLPGSPIQLGSP